MTHGAVALQAGPVSLRGWPCLRAGWFTIAKALSLAMVCLGFLPDPARGGASMEPPVCLSPVALAITKAGDRVYIACATAKRVLCLNTTTGALEDSITLLGAPSGLTLSRDETRLFVTRAAPRSELDIFVLTNSGGKIERVPAWRATQTNDPRPVGSRAINAGRFAAIQAGHTATAPVVSPNGRALYVCNRFDNDVSILDLASRSETGRIRVHREPVAAAVTPDGRFMFVANRLHTGRADVDTVAAAISVLDLVADTLERDLQLPNGSGVVSDLRISPNGHYAAVTHLVASFNRAASQVAFGWMNANALTIIDVERMTTLFTVLLDSPGQGAANPAAAAWSPDGAILAVAHAGTHELSIIDFPKLLQSASQQPVAPTRLRASSGQSGASAGTPVLAFVTRYEGFDAGLPFLVGARHRIRLPGGDLGPRSIAVAGHTAYVANYFSDTLSVIDLTAQPPGVESIDLQSGLVTKAERSRSMRDDGQGREAALARMSLERRGEFYFHDATICLEGWQSCASCHPDDARTDGLNWDLLNDGIGNPKNTKSLLLAHRTPPAMSLGVRETAEMAVRAGIRHILFSEQPEGVPAAIDAYLKTLQPVPSPYLVYEHSPLTDSGHSDVGSPGRFSEAAQRGHAMFARAGCVACHPPGLFTDLHAHDVGTRRGFDNAAGKFDTPTLIELWRTAPYLHDGSAATVRDVLTSRNPLGLHGETSALTPRNLDDLCAYLLSL